MRNLTATTAVAALCLCAVAAPATTNAAGHENCFDKGSMKYIECKSPKKDTGPKFVQFTDGAEYEGAYVALRGGLQQSQDIDFDAGAATQFDSEFEAGYVASGAIGYQFVDVEPGFDLRLELELGYQEADVDQALINGANLGSGGQASVAYSFVNVYGDWQLAPKWEVFVGGGLGLGVVDIEQDGAAGFAALGDDDAAFGFHLDAGLSYQISKDVSLEGSYRFSSFQDAEIGGAGDEIDLDSHQLLLGVKFKM